MILTTVVDSLKKTIESNWLALAVFVLVFPVRELEYYAGLMIALGVSFLALKECQSRHFSYLILAIIWIAFGQYLSIHNTRGIELPVFVLSTVCVWIGQLNYVEIVKLMRPLEWLSVPILAIQLVAFSSDQIIFNDIFLNRQLGGLSPAQSAALIGLLMVSSIYRFYFNISRNEFKILNFLFSVVSLVSAFVMALATWQRTAYLIPLFSIVSYLFFKGLSSSRRYYRASSLIIGFCFVGLFLAFASFFPTIGTIKFGFTNSEFVRLDAMQCVLSGAFQSPIGFLFGHGFVSLSDQCQSISSSPGGLIPYVPIFTKNIFSLGHAHNLVAQLIFSLGVPFGGAFCLFLFRGFVNCLKVVRNNNGVRVCSFDVYVFLVFMFCFVSSMVEISFLKVPALALIYGLVFGAALGLTRPTFEYFNNQGNINSQRNQKT